MSIAWTHSTPVYRRWIALHVTDFQPKVYFMHAFLNKFAAIDLGVLMSCVNKVYFVVLLY